MFENIIGHPDTVAQLTADIQNTMLPPSILFAGEPYTGKLTTALELARVLSCKKTGTWGCGCSSCSRHRLLESGNTVMLTTRSFLQEIHVCGDTLLRTMNVPARYMYIRAVRKLIHKFDDVLWRNEDQKMKKISPHLEKLEENMAPLGLAEKLPPRQQLEKILSSVVTTAARIEAMVKSDGIPVHQIRNATYWVHTTNSEGNKIVILDTVDKLGDGSRNALLKVLEETPPSVFFILLSARREGIISTILSRVRTYLFTPRNAASTRQVIQRIFRETEDLPGSLERYFLNKGTGNSEELYNYAVETLSAVTGAAGTATLSRLERIIEYVAAGDLFVPFLKELAGVLQKILHGEMENFENVSIPALVSWYTAIDEVLAGRESYNQNPSLLLSSLCTMMREKRP